MDRIQFYRVGGAFGQFSNFAPCPITLDAQIWPTSEHYFQAQKFADAERQERIRRTFSPMEAAKLGRDRDCPIRDDWDDIRDEVMRTAVMAKFAQHPDLQTLLLSTGDAELVEHTKNDAYWGDGGDGQGHNRLGQILMETREALRQA